MKVWGEWFYKSQAWKDCRAGFMASRLWLCERCDHPATIAHHRVYLTPDNIRDPLISLNWDNLEALCQDCHNKEHHKTIERRYLFDEDGTVIPPIEG
mgnify:FL=1